ncbi:hypothetical protein CCP2SC5_200007 [Azospirillaceae bacterium]
MYDFIEFGVDCVLCSFYAFDRLRLSAPLLRLSVYRRFFAPSKKDPF